MKGELPLQSSIELGSAFMATKRKLEEVDGVSESCLCEHPHVRRRREPREEGAECSGKEWQDRKVEVQTSTVVAGDDDRDHANSGSGDTSMDVENVEKYEDLPEVQGKEYGLEHLQDHNLLPVAEASCSPISDIRIGKGDDLKACGYVGKDPARLQFFVRTYMYGRTLVLQASSSDTVELVHENIALRTGLPALGQRLIYNGRQLQYEQTLEACHVRPDSTLQLVARMRSTTLPCSWQLAGYVVSAVHSLRSLQEAGTPEMSLTVLQYRESVLTGVHLFLKMACEPLPVSDHMQVLLLSGATSALVMLLLSPIEANRACAVECISLFLSGNDDDMPSSVRCHCAPIVLDFCKLLSKCDPSNVLYSTCRSSLARLLETTCYAHGSIYFPDATPETIVRDFAPIVGDISGALLSNLRSVAAADSFRDAKDLFAFMVPLCRAITSCEGFTSGEECSRGKSSIEGSPNGNSISSKKDIGSESWLQGLFSELLYGMNKFLSSITSEPSAGMCGGALLVLRALHEIGKVLEGTTEHLVMMLCVQRSALNVLIRQANCQIDSFWLLEHKLLLDFESKKQLVLEMLPEVQDDHEERLEISVHRSELLAESFDSLAYTNAEALQSGIAVEFVSEEATGPGVLREWFSIVCRSIFNPQNALFLACPTDQRRFFPNPASGVNPGHLTYFRFCGRVIALALMHRVQVDILFAVSFTKQIAGFPISWEDCRDSDPCLYDSCKKLLEMESDDMDSDMLGLTFTSEEQMLGSHSITELCPGGKGIVVNSKNRLEFVELLVRQKLVTSVAEQVRSFCQGFEDLLSCRTLEEFFMGLDVEDFDMLMYGRDRAISVDDWKMHTEYHDYESSDEQMVWFWQVVEGMTTEQRRGLLFFATSVAHLPAEGFAGLPYRFHIFRAYTDVSWLPTAHTCFYQLLLPAYPSFEIMNARLHAITERHTVEGFGFA